ncbi:MAG: DUF6476 family protein [Gemmobacter sp.]
MADAPQEGNTRLPASVRLLQWLVIGLTASMMIGVIAVVAVVVTRFPKPPTPPLPETLSLPAGARAVAVTQGSDWVAVVTDGDAILIFDRSTGALRQTVQVIRPDE